MSEQIATIAEQLEELEKQYEERMSRELKEIRETYESRDDRMQRGMNAYRRVLREIAALSDIEIYKTNTSPSEWEWGPKRDFPQDELETMADVLAERLQMAKDFETILTHIKTDDALMDIWDNLCLMMRLREEI